ncbi:hypothetical protein WJX72_000537 [[Myrmecia] bisecta]|uniref:H/ACA ribonucleoprotein complex non-core subunit NAF1 n=1 Tax=[Myrmecia] bisecta TaxID=41462 RepID=A0AAW1PGU2_9CHLO
MQGGVGGNDLATAAAHAFGLAPPAPQHYQGGPRPRHNHQQRGDHQQEYPDVQFEGELPSVDDLEIAAAAAAAGMEQLAKLAAGQSSSSEYESSSEEGSSSEEESSEDESEPDSTSDVDMTDALPGSTKGPAVVHVDLAVVDDRVQLRLTDLSKAGKGPVVEAGPASSKDEEAAEREAAIQVESSSDDESEVFDAADLRAVIDKMEEEGGDADEAAREEASTVPPVEPLDVEIGPEDILHPCGSVSGLLEGMIVVQAPEMGRALNENSVLCLADRTPLGRIEEVFGPVMSPLYALRYAGGGELPASVVPGARVCSVEKFSAFVLPDQLYGKAYDEKVEGDAAEDEFQFSDDEKEAEWKRTQKTAKRKTRDGLDAEAAGEAGGAPAAANGHAGHAGGGAQRGGRGRGGRGGGRGRQGGRGRGSGGPPGAFQAQATAGQMMSHLHIHPPAPPPGRPPHPQPRAGGNYPPQGPGFYQGHNYQQQLPGSGYPPQHGGPQYSGGPPSGQPMGYAPSNQGMQQYEGAQYYDPQASVYADPQQQGADEQ